MLRVVLDTNVLASGFRGRLVSQSPPAHIVRAWVRGDYPLLTSDHLMAEIRRALAKPYFVSTMSPEIVSVALDQIAQQAEEINVVPPVPKVATYWQDDLVLAAALAGEADHLVTGDGELLALGSYGDTSIVTVNEFVSILDAAGKD